MLWKGKVEKWSLDIVMKDNDDDDDFVLAFMYICICNGRNKPKFVIDVNRESWDTVSVSNGV